MEAQSAMLFRLNNHHGQKYNMVKSGSFGHQVNSDSDLVFFHNFNFWKVQKPKLSHANFKILASPCHYTDFFESYLVGTVLPKAGFHATGICIIRTILNFY